MKVNVRRSLVVSYSLQDAHSNEIDRRINFLPSVWITPLSRAEIANLIQQSVFRRNVSPSEARLAGSDFMQDCALGIWTVIDLPPGGWQASTDLARQYGPALCVRTPDSLHVACALELKAWRFWTFDKRQAGLAEAAGLDTSS